MGVYIDGVYLARTSGATISVLDLERVEMLKVAAWGKNLTDESEIVYDLSRLAFSTTCHACMVWTLPSRSRRGAIGKLRTPLVRGFFMLVSERYLKVDKTYCMFKFQKMRTSHE